MNSIASKTLNRNSFYELYQINDSSPIESQFFLGYDLAWSEPYASFVRHTSLPLLLEEFWPLINEGREANQPLSLAAISLHFFALATLNPWLFCCNIFPQTSQRFLKKHNALCWGIRDPRGCTQIRIRGWADVSDLLFHPRCYLKKELDLEV